MWWLIGVIVFIAAFAVPKFGKALAAIIALAVMAIGLTIMYEDSQQKIAKTRISSAEIQLTDMFLAPSYGTYKLTGRVKNLSKQYTLSNFAIAVVMQDCLSGKPCETIGENEVNVWSSIPPGQVRSIDELVYFSNMPTPKGKTSWSYSIKDIEGK